MTAAATWPGREVLAGEVGVVDALGVEAHVERVLERRVAVGRLLQPEHVDARLELARARHVEQLRGLRRADRGSVERVDGLGHQRLEAVVVGQRDVAAAVELTRRSSLMNRSRSPRPTSSIASDARAASTARTMSESAAPIDASIRG